MTELTTIDKLELKHAKIYNELIDTIDQLMIQVAKNKLEDSNDNQNDVLNNLLKDYPSLDLATLHLEIQSKLDKDDSTNEDHMKEFLEGLLKLRRMIIAQHLITYPGLKEVYGEHNDIYGARLHDSSQEFALKTQEFDDKIADSDGNATGLEDTKLKAIQKLDKVRDEARYYNRLCLAIARDNEENELQDDSESINHQILEKKCASLVRKSQILSQFNTNMISSLTSTNVMQDAKLRDIVQYCGDYEQYK